MSAASFLLWSGSKIPLTRLSGGAASILETAQPSEQELSQLVSHGRWHAFGMVVFVELPQSFMAELGKTHPAP
jgi:hypothetical protein